MITIDDLIQIYEEERPELTPYLDRKLKKFIIPESDLKLFFMCPYSYFLRNKIGFNKMSFSGSMLAALHFKNKRRELLGVRDPKVGELFLYERCAGHETKDIEEMNQDELKIYWKYQSAETFGNALQGDWHRFVESMSKEREIIWEFKDQIGVVGHHLMIAGRNYYNYLLNEGIPDVATADDLITFNYKGYTFRVKIPEVRPGLFIDDPNIHRFEADISKSLMVTLRLLGFSTLVKGTDFPQEQDFYARRWHVPGEIKQGLVNNDYILIPDLEYRHTHLSLEPPAMSTTKRNDSEITQLMHAVEEIFLRSLYSEDFRPNHKSCPICPFNVLDLNLKPICHEKKRGLKTAVPSQVYNPHSFVIQTESNLIAGYVQIKGFIKKIKKLTLEQSIATKLPQELEIKKQVASYILYLRPNLRDNTLEVISQYNSEAHGFGFEIPILEKADDVLEELVSDYDFVVHRINFEKNFGFVAGKTAIETALRSMDYKGPRNELVKYYEKQP